MDKYYKALIALAGGTIGNYVAILGADNSIARIISRGILLLTAFFVYLVKNAPMTPPNKGD